MKIERDDDSPLPEYKLSPSTNPLIMFNLVKTVPGQASVAVGFYFPSLFLVLREDEDLSTKQYDWLCADLRPESFADKDLKHSGLEEALPVTFAEHTPEEHHAAFYRF